MRSASGCASTQSRMVPKARSASFSPAFASDLDGWIEAHRPDYWFFGHTYRPLSTRIRGAPDVNVSLGYPDEVPEGGEAEFLLRGLIFPGA